MSSARVPRLGLRGVIHLQVIVDEQACRRGRHSRACRNPLMEDLPAGGGEGVGRLGPPRRKLHIVAGRTDNEERMGRRRRAVGRLSDGGDLGDR